MKSLISSFKQLLFSSVCPACEEAFEEEGMHLCKNCMDFFSAESLKKYKETYYIWTYNEVFKRVIEEFKFYGKKGLAKDLAAALKKKIEFVMKTEKIDVIVPIPIHQKRMNERGFNQVEEVLKELGISYINCKRVKNTKHMFEILNVEKRNKNIHECFEIDSKINLSGKNILIIDDIITTGSTINEMRKTCSAKGAADIRAFVFSAAPFFIEQIKKENETIDKTYKR